MCLEANLEQSNMDGEQARSKVDDLAGQLQTQSDIMAALQSELDSRQLADSDTYQNTVEQQQKLQQAEAQLQGKIEECEAMRQQIASLEQQFLNEQNNSHSSAGLVQELQHAKTSAESNAGEFLFCSIDHVCFFCFWMKPIFFLLDSCDREESKSNGSSHLAHWGHAVPEQHTPMICLQRKKLWTEISQLISMLPNGSS